jgi:hypothetical protein
MLLRVGWQIGNKSRPKVIDESSRRGCIADGDRFAGQAFVGVNERKSVAPHGWPYADAAVREADCRAEPHGATIGHEPSALRCAEIVDPGGLAHSYFASVARVQQRSVDQLLLCLLIHLRVDVCFPALTPFDTPW